MTIERLDVVGPFLGSSGYDRHTREFVRALATLGVDVGLTSLDAWSTPMPAEMRDPWFETLPRTTGAGMVLHFAMPSHVWLRPGVRNVNYTMFEADGIPAAWAAAAGDCDLVVVPTQTGRDAWTSTGVDAAHVRVSPLGVDGAFFSRPSQPLPLTLDDGRPVAGFTTRFLHVGELRPRKNQIGLLRAWLTATVAGDDAVLILKCPPVLPAIAQLAADVQALERELGRGLADAAPACLLPMLLTDEQMLALYATATHYVSLSHGEGWDQVMMEAAVAGLHLVAPKHTSYLEYLHDGDAEFIPSTLGPATFGGHICPEDRALFDGLSWWHPDGAATAEILRGAIDGRRARHVPPSARIASTFTWQAAAKHLAEVLDDHSTTSTDRAGSSASTGVRPRRRGGAQVDQLPTLEVQTTVGPMLVHRDDEMITRNLMRWGLWEASETHFLRTILRPGSVFVDVGANIGYFTRLGAACVGVDGSVIALEPEPRNLALLRANLAGSRCPNVSVLEVAAYSAPCWMSLRLNEVNRGDHGLAPAGETDLRVRCVRLDDVLPSVVDVVKIDTQGFDHDVISGLAATIATNPNLVIVSELAVDVIVGRGLDPIAVLRGYAALGLACSILDYRGTSGPLSAADVLLRARACRRPRAHARAAPGLTPRHARGRTLGLLR